MARHGVWWNGFGPVYRPWPWRLFAPVRGLKADAVRLQGGDLLLTAHTVSLVDQQGYPAVLFTFPRPLHGLRLLTAVTL